MGDDPMFHGRRSCDSSRNRRGQLSRMAVITLSGCQLTHPANIISNGRRVGNSEVVAAEYVGSPRIVRH
jgi:hypothetical protein